MNNNEETRGNINEEEQTKYMIDRAKKYIHTYSSKDGSEDNLDVCIISDLLRVIRRLSKWNFSRS